MKTHLLSILAVLALGFTRSFGHGGVELGPNNGHLLEFSKNESLQGEVVLKDGKFEIALLDKDLKPVALEAQELTATTGDKAKPEKLTVERKDGKFVVPLVKEGEWIIFQFRDTAKAKPITARLHYDTKTCSACKAPEWLCECNRNADKKEK